MKRFTLAVLLTVCSGLVFAQNTQNDFLPVAQITYNGTETITGKDLRLAITRMVRQQLASQAIMQLGSAVVLTPNEAFNDKVVNDNTGRLTKEQKMAILDSLISEKLFLQAAKKARISVSDSDINNAVNMQRAQLAQQLQTPLTADTEFNAAIRAIYGYTPAEFRDFVRNSLISEKYLQQEKGAQLQGAAPTDKDIQEFYDQNETQFIQPEFVQGFIIRVPFTNESEKVKAKTRADSLLKEIGNSSSKFDSVYMASQASGQYQAEPFTMGKNPANAQAMGQALYDTCFSLAKDKISGIVEGPNGYYIVKITEKQSKKFLGLGDPVSPGQDMTVRDYIRQGLAQQNQAAAVQTATADILKIIKVENKTYKILNQNLTWL